MQIAVGASLFCFGVAMTARTRNTKKNSFLFWQRHKRKRNIHDEGELMEETTIDCTTKRAT